MNKIVPYLNEHTGPILAYFNGEELDLDSESQVKEYFFENDLDEEKLEDIKFREKTYAWFRGWMDDDHVSDDVKRKVIIKVAREMIMTRNWDSRDIDEERYPILLGDLWEEYGVEDMVLGGDNLYIPSIDLGELKKFSGGYLCGGGQHECLAEIQLLMNALNIKYKLMREFIY
jgi:hypothetical protein